MITGGLYDACLTEQGNRLTADPLPFPPHSCPECCDLDDFNEGDDYDT